MQVKLLGGNGLYASEARAVKRMETDLRDSWFAYASLLVADDQGSMDIDVLIITHDRLLLVELKEWNGKLESADGRWYLNGSSRGKSPYEIKRVHAIRLQKLIQQELGHKLGYFPHVEAHVVLCGSATPDRLSTSERRYVHTLDEFLEISGREAYEQLVGDQSNAVRLYDQMGKPRPNSSSCLPVIQAFFAGSRVKPKEFKSHHFVADSTPWFEHRNLLYKEYKGSHEEQANDIALMRRWDFTQLGVGNAIQAQWAEIALRESRVIRHAKQHSSPLEEYLLKPLIPLGESDITEDVTELYELRRTFSRLDEFIHREGKRALPETRLDWVRALLAPVAELHGLGIGHRDIDLHNLWYASEQRSIVVSGLATAFYPERGTINDLREHLQGTDMRLPEDAMRAEGDILDPFRQDVFMLAVVAYRLCYPESSLEYDSSKIPVWSVPQDDVYKGLLDKWFQKALRWDPNERYPSANEQLAAFNQLTKRDDQGEADSSALLESLTEGDFIKRGWNPFTLYQEFPPLPGEDPGAGTKLSYRCSRDGRTALCKMWLKVAVDPKLPGFNRRVASFRARVEKVRASGLPTPDVLDFGLLETGGLYLVTLFEPGVPWREHATALNGEQRVALGLSLTKAVVQCHEQGIAHGDLHPNNLTVAIDQAEEQENKEQAPLPHVRLLDLLDFGGTSEPFNLEYGPKNPAAADSMARDRHAVYRLVQELVAEQSEHDALSEELCLGLSQPNGIPVSLEPLEQALSAALQPAPTEEKATAKAAVPLDIRWPTRFFPDAALDLEPDGDIYYFNCKWDRKNPDLLYCYITAVNAALTVALNPEQRQIEKFWFRGDIPLSTLISAAGKATARLERPITVTRGIPDPQAAADLIDILLSLDPVLTLLEEKYSPECENGEPEVELEAKQAVPAISPRVLWNALVQTEDANLLAVEVDKGEIKENQAGRLLIPYRTFGGQPLDFDADNSVFVTIEGDDSPIGELEVRETTPDLIAVKPSRPRLQKLLPEGAVLRLESVQSKASRDRKQKALERVLDRASVIPNLADYFDPDNAPLPSSAHPMPSAEELRALYNTSSYELNDKQLGAFQRLISHGPVGVLQGPPGTGKTSFVANFIHYIFSVLGARNVLLVGQSHTSVDAVAIKAREVCAEKSFDLSVVRMGQEQMIARDMLDAHSSALQRQTRHAFHRQYDQRLKVFASRFGLPDRLIEEVAVAHRTLSPVIALLRHCNEELAKMHQQQDANNKLVEQVREQCSSLQNLVEKILYQRYPEVANRLTALSDAMAGVIQYLCHEHRVNNPAAVSRLGSLLELSREWLDVLATGAANYDQFLVQTRQLVCGTLVGMGHKQYGVAEVEFDWVIVDEAARAQASELMIPLQSAHRALLVGDHRQLPPYYEKAHLRAAARHIDSGSDSSVFRITDFERAFHATGGITLDTQYRMVEPVGKLVSHCFYRDEVGSLETGRGPSPDWYRKLPAPWNAPVTWIDSSGEAMMGEKEIKPGRYTNRHEANLIMTLLEHLSERDTVKNLRASADGSKGYPIGIITMYRAQKELLEKKLSKAEWAATLRDLIRIDTVDSYQGQENKIILLSLVRDNPMERQGFLADRARINVSISRAQERLVIVGAARMWKRRNVDSALGDVLAFIQERVSSGDQSYAIVRGSQWGKTTELSGVGGIANV